MKTTIKTRQFEVAEIQLSYKTKVKPSQRPKISSSKDAYSILLEFWDEDKIIYDKTVQTKYGGYMKIGTTLGANGNLFDSLYFYKLLKAYLFRRHRIYQIEARWRWNLPIGYRG